MARLNFLLTALVFAIEQTSPFNQTAATISISVIDSTNGIPGRNFTVQSSYFNGTSFIDIAITQTDHEGVVSDVHNGAQLHKGIYKLRFEVAEYFHRLSTNQVSFYPYIEIVFSLDNVDGDYYIPLVLTRFGFSTYGGKMRNTAKTSITNSLASSRPQPTISSSFTATAASNHLQPLQKLSHRIFFLLILRSFCSMLFCY